MKIKFWGVRGSVPTSGPTTSLYGGSTSCVEITEGKSRIILDAGTGLRPLGELLIKKPNTTPFSLFISHCHLDHIIGLPFFRPLHHHNQSIHLYGPQGQHRNFSEIIASLFEEEFFPVPFSKIPALLTFRELKEETISLPPFEINSFFINHPGSTLGYVIRVGKKRFAYLCDHEPISGHSHLSPEKFPDYEKNLLEHLKDVDLLIHDAFFSHNLYGSFRGWGHSPWSYSVELASQANIKKVFFFHYAPEVTDSQLQKRFKVFQKDLKNKKTPKVSLAREGQIISL